MALKDERINYSCNMIKIQIPTFFVFIKTMICCLTFNIFFCLFAFIMSVW